jgi:hypothetical protein
MLRDFEASTLTNRSRGAKEEGYILASHQFPQCSDLAARICTFPASQPQGRSYSLAAGGGPEISFFVSVPTNNRDWAEDWRLLSLTNIFLRAASSGNPRTVQTTSLHFPSFDRPSLGTRPRAVTAVVCEIIIQYILEVEHNPSSHHGSGKVGKAAAECAHWYVYAPRMCDVGDMPG